jgi:malonyl-CoA/methylmalonyl-CoA synthetase
VNPTNEFELIIADIRYRGLRVPVLEVVACLLDQPFIAEAYVVPVLDIFAGGKQVAIVIRLRKSSLVPAELQEGAPKGSALSLHALRVHLSQFLEEYKLPTILHILGDEQDVPRSQSGKPLLNAIAGEFFPQPLEGSLEGLPAEVQVCRTIIRRNPVAWDWGALRY